MPHFHSRDIGDRIEGPRRKDAGLDTEFSGSGPLILGQHRGAEQKKG